MAKYETDDKRYCPLIKENCIEGKCMAHRTSYYGDEYCGFFEGMNTLVTSICGQEK